MRILAQNIVFLMISIFLSATGYAQTPELDKLTRDFIAKAQPGMIKAIEPLTEPSSVATTLNMIASMKKTQIDLFSDMVAACVQVVSNTDNDPCSLRRREYEIRFAASPQEIRLVNALGAAHAQLSPGSFKMDTKPAMSAISSFYDKVKPAIQSRYRELQ